jgi:CubicO group peptidase (beta-lactamase class C family)
MKTIYLLFLSFSLLAQGSLPRATPESQGVDSDAIMRFLDAAAKSEVEFHSMMMVRHGKVIAEGWWNPYASDLKHTMYSVSKSFTATAIGFAVSEGRLKVSDKVISFFPDKLPSVVNENLAALEIKHLLSMSVGNEKEPMGIILGQDWVKDFLASPIENQPGSKFLYNSAATYMLSAIIQKVTGQKTIEYLRPRLFEPLDIKGIDWEVDPQGINVGGWGLRLKTEDMAKFGQLFLQKGKWNGKQILPESWITEASTSKIMQNPDATPDQLSNNDWIQGYCYQMWRCRNNTYRGDGANGQFIIVMPDQDAVVILTAETTNMQAEIDLVWKHLLPAFGKKAIPENPSKSTALNSRLKSLSLPISDAIDQSSIENRINGKSISIYDGEKGFHGITINFDNQNMGLIIKTDSVDHFLSFGREQWNHQKTTKLGPYLVARATANRKGLDPFKIAGSFTWKTAHHLELTLRYIESPHTETIDMYFEENNKVKVDFKNIFNQKQERVVNKGIITF